jgi:hypothetical protein
MSPADETMLGCYVVLDAIRRGVGTNALFSILGQHMLLAQNLCRQGYQTARFEVVRSAQRALLVLRQRAETSSSWELDDVGYKALCAGLNVLAEQLKTAPTDEIVAARNDMLHLIARTRRAA